jgi:hypothetical protein
VLQILNDQIETPTRATASVLLEEIDGDDVQIRVQATPERAIDGAQLADEIIAALASVTGEHHVSRDGGQDDARSSLDGNDDTRLSRDGGGGDTQLSTGGGDAQFSRD